MVDSRWKARHTYLAGIWLRSRRQLIWDGASHCTPVLWNSKGPSGLLPHNFWIREYALAHLLFFNRTLESHTLTCHRSFEHSCFHQYSIWKAQPVLFPPFLIVCTLHECSKDTTLLKILFTKMDADYYSSAIALLENAAAEFKRSVDKQIVAFENEQKLHEETIRSIDGWKWRRYMNFRKNRGAPAKRKGTSWKEELKGCRCIR